MRIEGWPEGVATAKWDIGELIRDNSYEVEIPEGTPPGLYRIEVSFYDPATLDNLPVTSANTGEVLAQPYILDYLIVGNLPENPAHAIDPPAEFRRADRPLRRGPARRRRQAAAPPRPKLPPRRRRQPAPLLARPGLHDHRLHRLRPRGRPGRADDRPAGSTAHERLPAHLLLAAPPGHHGRLRRATCPPMRRRATTRSWSGLYDLASMARLPVTRNGEPSGDSVVAATFSVQAAP